MSNQKNKGLNLKLKNLGILFLFSISLFSFGCNNEDNKENKTTPQESVAVTQSAAPVDDGKGVGPVKELILKPEIDLKLATEGQKIFQMKCAACHKFDAKYVGPALKGVTERRKPEWIMNMIINPIEMTQKDPTAKKLFAESMTQMAMMNIKEPEARSILEYFRAHEKGLITEKK